MSYEAWVEADQIGKLDDRMFVARAVGRSMEPTIHDGDLLVFRANPVVTRKGKIVLAQYCGPADPETGGSFTVKRYSACPVLLHGHDRLPTMDQVLALDFECDDMHGTVWLIGTCVANGTHRKYLFLWEDTPIRQRAHHDASRFLHRASPVLPCFPHFF